MTMKVIEMTPTQRFTPQEIETIVEQARQSVDSHVYAGYVSPIDQEEWRQGLAKYDRNADELHVIGLHESLVLKIKKGRGIWWESTTTTSVGIDFEL